MVIADKGIIACGIVKPIEESLRAEHVDVEVYKYIPLPRDPALADSAADVLPEPVLCGEAVGTLAVKKPFRRIDHADPKFQVR